MEKFEREFLSSIAKQRELGTKSKNALKPLQSLQSINEDEGTLLFLLNILQADIYNSVGKSYFQAPAKATSK